MAQSMKLPIKCPCIIKDFQEHKHLKNDLLNAIKTHRSDPEININKGLNISRTDFFSDADNFNKSWVHILGKSFHAHLLSICSELQFQTYTMKHIWFQQYEINGGHSWHNHGGNWASVYYLNTPKNIDKPEFINPFDNSIVETFDIKEGQTITFPSFIRHRSPINTSNEIRTIIAWNMDTK